MQDEFNFDAPPDATQDGLASWRRSRLSKIESFAANNGLPIGHRCRVELRDGTELEGILMLGTDDAPIDVGRDPKRLLRIKRCTFQVAEVASLVRLEPERRSPANEDDES